MGLTPGEDSGAAEVLASPLPSAACQNRSAGSFLPCVLPCPGPRGACLPMSSTMETFPWSRFHQEKQRWGGWGELHKHRRSTAVLQLWWHIRECEVGSSTPLWAAQVLPSCQSCSGCGTAGRRKQLGCLIPRLPNRHAVDPQKHFGNSPPPPSMFVFISCFRNATETKLQKGHLINCVLTSVLLPVLCRTKQQASPQT